MIVQNCLSLLTQISEIEDKIQKIEGYIRSQGLEIDREAVLKQVLAKWQVDQKKKIKG